MSRTDYTLRPGPGRLFPRRLLLLACILLTAAVMRSSGEADSGASADRCPPSRTIPGGLPHDETPQFILVTFDDGITPFAESLIQPVLQDLHNPDGSKAHYTYFLTRVNTVAALARQRYLEGNELASHTMTHSTGNQTNAAEWLWELNGLNRFLVDTVGIPSNQIAGFRAPELATNGAMWRTLLNLQFIYDASLPEVIATPPRISTGLDSLVWPHTLEGGSGTSCSSGNCPDTSLPGLWSIPLWMFYDTLNNEVGAMDPAAGDDSLLQEVLEFTFQKRYNGNKCPLGLFMHAGQLGLPGRRQILTTFLQEKLKLPDVWMITMRGLIEWMRNPVPVSQLSAWFARGADRGSGRPDLAPPPSVSLAAPDDGSPISPKTALLQWDVQLKSAAYQLQVSSASDFSQNVLDSAGISRASYSFRIPASPASYFWRVRGVNTRGPGDWSLPRTFTSGVLSHVSESPARPLEYGLEQNFPNPFNPSTVISCSFPSSGRARLAIYDMLGREVAVLIDGPGQAGRQGVIWNAAGKASGTFLCRLEFDGTRTTLTRKIVFLK